MISYRKAAPEDCAALALVKQKVWQITYRGIYPDSKIDNYSLTENEQYFLSLIQTSDISLFVAHRGKEIIGYMCCGKPLHPFREYRQELALLYVLPEYQGHGVGKALFSIARQQFEAVFCREFFISVNRYNLNALNFYLHLGGLVAEIDEDKPDKSEVQIKLCFKIPPQSE